MALQLPGSLNLAPINVMQDVLKTPEAFQKLQEQAILNKHNEMLNALLAPKVPLAKQFTDADLAKAQLDNIHQSLINKYFAPQTEAGIDLTRAQTGEARSNIPLHEANARNLMAKAQSEEMQNSLLRKAFAPDAKPEDTANALNIIRQMKMATEGREPIEAQIQKTEDIAESKEYRKQFDDEQKLAIRDASKSSETIELLNQFGNAMNSYYEKHKSAPSGLPSLLDAAKLSDDAINNYAKYDPDLARVLMIQRQLGTQAFEGAKNVRTQREFNYIVNTFSNLNMPREAFNKSIKSSIAQFKRKQNYNDFLSSEKKKKTLIADAVSKWGKYAEDNPLTDAEGNVINEHIGNHNDYFSGNEDINHMIQEGGANIKKEDFAKMSKDKQKKILDALEQSQGK